MFAFSIFFYFLFFLLFLVLCWHFSGFEFYDWLHPSSPPGCWSRIRSCKCICDPPLSWIMGLWWSWYQTNGQLSLSPETMLFAFWGGGQYFSTIQSRSFPGTLEVLASGRFGLWFSTTSNSHPPRAPSTFSIQESQMPGPNNLLLDEKPNWSLPSVLLIILGFCSILDIGEVLSLEFLFYIHHHYDNNKEN